jgi:hypothetical protein
MLCPFRYVGLLHVEHGHIAGRARRLFDLRDDAFTARASGAEDFDFSFSVCDFVVHFP